MKPLVTDRPWKLSRVYINLYRSHSLPLFIAMHWRKMCRVWSFYLIIEVPSVTMCWVAVFGWVKHSPVPTTPIFLRSQSLQSFPHQYPNATWNEQDFKTPWKFKRMRRVTCSLSQKRSSRNSTLEGNDAGQSLWLQKVTTSRRLNDELIYLVVYLL